MTDRVSPRFQGWLGKTPEAAEGKMEWGDFEPKKWTEDDVDIEISHCGICGSDVHVLKSGWSQTPYPCVVGHEIVGKAIRVGNNVKHIRVGDRVGVGAQARSCLSSDCAECSNGKEMFCPTEHIQTYGSIYPNNEGKSYGGYANYNRTNGHFVFVIPDELDSVDAASMLCAGITVFSPLYQNGCGPGKSIGVIGLGGLGHFAVLFAKALNADKIIAISRKADKREDALKLGADKYIATDDGDQDWVIKNRRSLDLIICTVSSDKMPLQEYLTLLKPQGTFVQVGVPDGGSLPNISAFVLVTNGIKIGGSLIGAPGEIRQMLNLAVEKKIKPWVQTRPLKDANNAVVDMDAGKARYRYVLVNENYGMI
ncbi:hypothetical protein AB5N19_12503 [Seiridium cardinale]